MCGSGQWIVFEVHQVHSETNQFCIGSFRYLITLMLIQILISSVEVHSETNHISSGPFRYLSITLWLILIQISSVQVHSEMIISSFIIAGNLRHRSAPRGCTPRQAGRGECDLPRHRCGRFRGLLQEPELQGPHSHALDQGILSRSQVHRQDG